MKFFRTQLVELTTHNKPKVKFILRLTTTDYETNLQEMWHFQWLWYRLWNKFTFNFVDFLPCDFIKNYEYQKTKDYDIFDIEIYKKVR